MQFKKTKGVILKAVAPLSVCRRSERRRESLEKPGGQVIYFKAP